MRKIYIYCVIGIFFHPFIDQTAAGQHPPFQTATFEMRVIEQEGERKTEGLSKVWIDFNEQRYTAETEMAGPDGKKSKYVTIQSDGKVFILNVEAKTAQEIPCSEHGKTLMNWDNSPDYKRFGGVIVGTDTVAGKETDIYEYIRFEERIPLSPGQEGGVDIGTEGTDELQEIITQSSIQLKVRQWIWKGTDFPLKTILDHGSKKNMTEILHIAVNVEIPERVFKVPKDYSLKKMRR